jgi:hypothetical protein
MTQELPKSIFESKTIYGALIVAVTHFTQADWSAWRADLPEHIFIALGVALAIYGRLVAKQRITTST